MKLDEAIKHCKEKAEELKKQHSELLERPNFDRQIVADCWECAKEHEQLAEWLEELKARREADRWISVTERLPEQDGKYLVQVDYIDEQVLYITNYAIGKGFTLVGITHWRPLPEAYKESEANNEQD